MHEKHTENHLKRDMKTCSSKIISQIVNSNSLGFKVFFDQNLLDY